MKLTAAQLSQLDSTYPILHKIIQQLKPVVKGEVIAELTQIQKTVESILQPHWRKEELSVDDEYKALEKIQKDNGLISIWSFSQVRAKDMENDMGFVKAIHYGPLSIVIGKNITWLDAWKYADALIKASKDLHHIFIENFDFNNCEVEFSTGS